MDRIESAYIGNVMRLSCAVCFHRGHNTPATEYHHTRAAEADVGGAQKAGNFLGMPLCGPCHQGAEGIHGKGSRAFARALGASEMQLINETLRRLTVMVELGEWAQRGNAR
jgi:hypothetical protein